MSEHNRLVVYGDTVTYNGERIPVVPGYPVTVHRKIINGEATPVSVDLTAVLPCGWYQTMRLSVDEWQGMNFTTTTPVTINTVFDYLTPCTPDDI